MAKRTAVIDIGSNSIRMVIFERTSRFGFHLLCEEKSSVRISQGMYEHDGFLQKAPMERALGALHDLLSIAASYKVRKTLCVATSAVRDAANKSDFLSLIWQQLGLNIKVIDGSKEAYYGGIACANLLPPMRGVTIDIGGGSTECACIDKGKILNTHSLNLGTVRIKELYLDKNDLKGAKAYIDAMLDALPITQTDHLIGIGGTFRALSNALIRNSTYPLDMLHGFRFDAAALTALGEKILKADEAGLKELGIKPERFDIIMSGTLILLRIIKRFNIRVLTASGVGVREGVFLHDLLRHNQDRFPANFNPSVRSLLDRFITEPHQANLLSKTAAALFDLLHVKLALPFEYRKPFVIAAKLAKIGTSVHFYSYHHHSYYLIQASLEYGFSHEEIMLIATLVRYQKKRTPKRVHKDQYALLLPDDSQLDRLSSLLTLADLLLTHAPREIDFELVLDNNTLHIHSKTSHYLRKERLKTFTIPTLNLEYH